MFVRASSLLGCLLLTACATSTARHPGGEPTPRVRGYLLHLTHYDPEWLKAKDHEPPFDLRLGLEVIDAIADSGLNTLVIDIEDGVQLADHPELTRPYSLPMKDFEALVRRAHERGLDVVPKLNFSKSAFFAHNQWFRPHDALRDTPEYWQKAFEVIDELLRVCQPKHYVHIGMDEDQDRTVPEYVAAIDTLSRGLAKRGLKAVMWNDSTEPNDKAVKALAAEKDLSRAVVQVPWAYHRLKPEVVERLRAEGFEVWGAPGTDPALVQGWRDDIVRLGGTGLLMTQWLPCVESNRRKILVTIRTLGPLYSGFEPR